MSGVATALSNPNQPSLIFQPGHRCRQIGTGFLGFLLFSPLAKQDLDFFSQAVGQNTFPEPSGRHAWDQPRGAQPHRWFHQTWQRRLQWQHRFIASATSWRLRSIALDDAVYFLPRFGILTFTPFRHPFPLP
jgi:hypothetical protein